MKEEMTDDQVNREQEMSRAEFIRSSLRWALAAGLGVLAFTVGRGKNNGVGEGERCVSGGICRGCPVLPRCKLPTAISMKQHDRKNLSGE